MTKEFNTDALMTEQEAEKLVKALLQDAEFQPYAVYGLIFLFSTVKTAIENDKAKFLEDIYQTALTTLYFHSDSIDNGIDRLTAILPETYRNVDFTKDYDECVRPFLEAEKREVTKDV